MSILSIRVEEKVKAKAMKILKKKGLDVSTAVNMYLREIIDADDAPCELCRKYLPKDTDPSSKKIRARLARESAEAMRQSGMTARQVMDSIFGKQRMQKSIVRNTKSKVIPEIRKAAGESAER